MKYFFSFLVFLLPFSASAATETITWGTVSQPANYTFGRTTSPRNNIALHFTPSQACQSAVVHIDMWHGGTVSDNVQIEIMSDASAVPSGTVLVSATPIAGSSLGTSGGGTLVDSSSMVYNYAAATEYWVNFHRTGSNDDTNNYKIEGNTATGDVASDQTGSWTIIDNNFAVRGNIVLTCNTPVAAMIETFFQSFFWW